MNKLALVAVVLAVGLGVLVLWFRTGERPEAERSSVSEDRRSSGLVPADGVADAGGSVDTAAPAEARSLAADDRTTPVAEALLRPDFLESVEHLSRAMHNQQANLDTVLDFAVDLAEAASRVEPVFDPLEGGLVYTIPGAGEGVNVQLIALPQTAPMRDQFRLRVQLPDAPGYRGPQDATNGSELSFHFNLADGGVTTCSASTQVQPRRTADLQGHVQALGPVQVASHLSVTADGATWTPLTLDYTTQDGQLGWLSTGGQQVPAVGNLSHPTIAQLHNLLEPLKPKGR